MSKNLQFKMYLEEVEIKALSKGKEINLGELHLAGMPMEVILIPRTASVVKEQTGGKTE